MNKTVLLIDALACGYELESAAMLAQMSIKEASTIASANTHTIEARKEEIVKHSEIMLPSKRWYYLTQAAKMGVEGYAVVTFTGFRQTYNPALALQAVKIANEMTSPTVSSDSLSVTQVVTEMYKDLMKTVEDSTEVWAMIKKALPEYIGVIETVQRNIAKKENFLSE